MNTTIDAPTYMGELMDWKTAVIQMGGRAELDKRAIEVYGYDKKHVALKSYRHPRVSLVVVRLAPSDTYFVQVYSRTASLTPYISRTITDVDCEMLADVVFGVFK